MDEQMTTFNEQLQNLWHRYEREHGGVPSPPIHVVEWAMKRGLLEAPRYDPKEALAEAMARALREEYRTDSSGRRYRVNHAVRITRNGVQTSLWAELDSAPRDHMIKAFAQRRRQIVGDCVQLKTDVDVYNDKHTDVDPIQVVLDFTDDVAEALIDTSDAA
jgi:hypothetical protein